MVPEKYASSGREGKHLEEGVFSEVETSGVRNSRNFNLGHPHGPFMFLP
jgi:hypothetical protein